MEVDEKLKLILFVDTNLFLQCKPLEEINWNDFGDFREINIIIPIQVLREIDDAKNSASNRKSKRARDFNRIHQNISSSKIGKWIIKNRDPLLTVAVTSGLPFGSAPPITLNLSIPDHHIVHEMILYRDKYPGNSVALLTGDLALTTTGKQHDFRVWEIPESWHLPPEPDERDKRIRRLEEEVKNLKSDLPDITITIKSDESPIDILEIPLIQYEPLSDSELESLISMAKELSPMTLFHFDTPNGIRINQSLLGFLSPSQESIQKYQTKDYPTWIHNLKDYFKTLHNKLSFQKSSNEFTLLIRNDGHSPGKGVVLEIESHGDVVLMPPEEVPINIPIPPEPPVWKIPLDVLGMETFSNSISQLTRKREKDPFEFYWTQSPPTEPMGKWTLTCEEFRHQVEPKECRIRVNLNPSSRKKSGMISIRISASNLRSPIKSHIDINVTESEEDTFNVAESQLKNLLTKEQTPHKWGRRSRGVRKG